MALQATFSTQGSLTKQVYNFFNEYCARYLGSLQMNFAYQTPIVDGTNALPDLVTVKCAVNVTTKCITSPLS